ncbi:MAG TPA: hypothetical protein VG204_09215 [Terriglobia bacterium]|nr:hypothetical protein [Terriglobia bacterium]
MKVDVTASGCGAPSAAAYIFNATVVPAGSLGYLTLWPQGETQPLVATLNAADGAITGNMAVVPTNNGSISAWATDPTQLVLDIFGYFGPNPNGPNATLSAASLNFRCRNVPNAGCQCLNIRTVTLSNLGTAPLSIESITIKGAFSQGNNCDSSLASGQSCTISVSWSGVNSAGEIYINDNAPGSLQTVTLSGIKECSPP